MNLDAIFHVLENLNDLEIIGHDSHFFFFSKQGQNFSQAKNLQIRTLHSLSLHSEAIAPIIREK